MGPNYLNLPDAAEEAAKAEEARVEARRAQVWSMIKARAKTLKRQRRLRNKYHCAR